MYLWVDLTSNWKGSTLHFIIIKQTNSFKSIYEVGHQDSTVLHVADLGWVPGNLYVPLSTASVIPYCRARTKSWVPPVWPKRRLTEILMLEIMTGYHSSITLGAKNWCWVFGYSEHLYNFSELNVGIHIYHLF